MIASTELPRLCSPIFFHPVKGPFQIHIFFMQIFHLARGNKVLESKQIFNFYQREDFWQDMKLKKSGDSSQIERYFSFLKIVVLLPL